MKINGKAKRMSVARRSRSSSRDSFFAKVQIAMPAGSSIAQRPPRKVQKDALQVGLFRFQAGQFELQLIQDRDEPQQGGFYVVALQLQACAGLLDQPCVRQLLNALAQCRRGLRDPE